jgi:hypothetical protein
VEKENNNSNEEVSKLPEIASAKITYQSALAFYNPREHKIYYNELLEYYPGLKARVLKHELSHAAHPENYFHHIWIDLRDYFLLKLDKDMYKLQGEIAMTEANYRPKNWYHFIFAVVYFFFNLAIQVLLLPVDVGTSLYFMFKKQK